MRSKKIKNKIRTFEPEIGQTIKNTQAEIQISSSYKKKSVYTANPIAGRNDLGIKYS